MTAKTITFLAKLLPKLHESALSKAIPCQFEINLILIVFIVNLNIPNQQSFNVKLLIGLRDHKFNNLCTNSYTSSLI